MVIYLFFIHNKKFQKDMFSFHLLQLFLFIVFPKNLVARSYFIFAAFPVYNFSKNLVAFTGLTNAH